MCASLFYLHVCPSAAALLYLIKNAIRFWQQCPSSSSSFTTIEKLSERFSLKKTLARLHCVQARLYSMDWVCAKNKGETGGAWGGHYEVNKTMQQQKMEDILTIFCVWPLSNRGVCPKLVKCEKPISSKTDQVMNKMTYTIDLDIAWDGYFFGGGLGPML